LKLFDAAATWNRGDGTSGRCRDVIAERVQQFFAAFPDAALTEVHLVPIDRDTVVVEWTLSGTQLNHWRVADR
jgi:hypothetical protein